MAHHSVPPGGSSGTADGRYRPVWRDAHDREILRLALPALGALIAEPLYVLSDTAVVGHLGTQQLAGMAIASSILLTAYSLFIFLAYGTTAAVARLLGAGDEREAAHQAVQGLWLAVLVGVVLMVGGWACSSALVTALGATGPVADAALLYLRISLVGVAPMLVVLAGTGYLRGLQDTVTPLVVAIVSAVVNLALEIVLIYGFGFGLAASAWTTVVVQFGAAAVYVVRIGGEVRSHHVGLAPHAGSLRRLGVVGRDLFLRTAALRGSLLLATAVAARIGTVALAAHQVAFEIWSFLALALDAIAIAGQALIGRYLGAGDVDSARRCGRRMLEWGIVAGVVSGIGLAVLRVPLAHVFSGDDAVVRVTAFVLVFVAAMQPVNGIVFVLDGLLIGAGDVGYLAKAMTVAFVAFVPGALFVAWRGLGIGWLWTALSVFMVARMVTLARRWVGSRWVVVGATR